MALMSYTNIEMMRLAYSCGRRCPFVPSHCTNVHFGFCSIHALDKTKVYQKLWTVKFFFSIELIWERALKQRVAAFTALEMPLKPLTSNPQGRHQALNS